MVQKKAPHGKHKRDANGNVLKKDGTLAKYRGNSGRKAKKQPKKLSPQEQVKRDIEAKIFEHNIELEYSGFFARRRIKREIKQLEKSLEELQ